MANPTLLASSLLSAVIHLYVLSAATDAFYYCMILRGLLSSVLNHGCTYAMLQQYDRFVMVESIGIDIYYMINSNTLHLTGPIIVMAICLYIASKRYGTSFHVAAHVALTMAHVLHLRQS